MRQSFLRSLFGGSRPAPARPGNTGKSARPAGKKSGSTKPPFLFNQAVDQQARVIFVAIPKTGTTSIREQMKRPGADYMVRKPHLDIRQIHDGLRAYFWVKSMSKNKGFPTDIEAVPDAAEVTRTFEEFYASTFKFSTVRNPWARVASLYARREGVQMAEGMDFDAFCLQIRYASDTCSVPTRHECQIDWLLDDRGEMAMDYVMRLEDIDTDLPKLKDLSGRDFDIEVKQKNVNPTSMSRSYRDLYSQEARDHIGAVFRRDIEAFGYSF